MSVIVEIDKELDAKLNKLNSELPSLGNILVAYSGGVDSALLAGAAHQVLPGKLLAVISDSPSLARATAGHYGFLRRVRHPLPADFNRRDATARVCAKRWYAMLSLQR
jgi:asparagine synthetase B (glutamine-hydrolysing)